MHPIKKILSKRNGGISTGIPSYCTSNKIVIRSILEYYLEINEHVLIECTANQVNQFGGYMNMTPSDFRDYVYDIADEINFPKDRIILGADHFGPLAWTDKNEDEAMKNAKELVRLAVLAGYTKIHLDTSMFLGSDDISKKLSDEVIAKRGAVLYKACEDAFNERIKKFPDSIHPVYVIGSEVPIPGGEYEEKKNMLEVTKVNDFENTINSYDKIFKEYGLNNAWENIIAIVVQPGVEFSNEDIHDYDRTQATELCKKLKDYPNLVFEGHSTDYQFKAKLKEMVKDGVAILKVGPALTYALREGLFSLSLMEKELIKDDEKSDFIEVLEETMLKNPKDWEKYYEGSELEKKLARKYSFSDRSRYYMAQDDINTSINKLFANIDSFDISLGMIKQYFPNAYLKIRAKNLSKNAENLVKSNIKDIIDDYYNAIE